jgi:hypothetical protein
METRSPGLWRSGLYFFSGFSIEPPPVSKPVIVPFTKDEVAALLKACDQSRTWKTRTTTATLREAFGLKLVGRPTKPHLPVDNFGSKVPST